VGKPPTGGETAEGQAPVELVADNGPDQRAHGSADDQSEDAAADFSVPVHVKGWRKLTAV
jgi:hypothetical protein